MIRAAAALLVCAPLVVLAQTPLSDFARGAEIRIDGGGSIFRVGLPDELYETVTRGDLADIRVLNAAGEAVPHAVREAPRGRDLAAEWRAVPAFPMSETEPGRSARTQVRIDSDGTVLEVTDDGATGTRVNAYLLDATAIKEPLARIALSWEASAGVTFLARVSVLRSDNLDAWQTIVPSAAIAQLQRETHTLTQNEIELPAGSERARYYRISWPQELASVTVTAVRVRPRDASAEREIRWKTLGAERVDTAGIAHYDARGVFPVEYVDLEFQDPTDAASVTVRSRPDTSGDWGLRHVGVFYALRESDTQLRSQTARVTPTTDRHWTLETARRDGWSRERPPRLKIGWHPHELLFLAQGAAPYTLVYGSVRTQAAEAPVDAILSSLTDSDRTNRVRLATLGPSRSLGGDAALHPPIPLRQLALWGVLVIAVAALAFVAVRLFRDTTSGAPPPQQGRT